jgi:lysophospholipid acyltransferase (LPLAT)-like uncharacterized protein
LEKKDGLVRRRGSWLERLLFAVGPWLIRIHASTLRVQILGLHHLEERLARGLPVVLAGWHQRFYMGILPFQRYRPVIMISRSRDGDRIAPVVARLGWRSVRGSSSRGGREALAALIGAVAGGAIGAHIVDGPRGPARRVKPGVVELAHETGAAIIPVSLSARRRWEAPSWDRFQVPLPFTRVRIEVHPPIEVRRQLSPAEQEEVREAVEKQLERGAAELDAAWGHADPTNP